jgi:mono/diheme cytochrome c family protein
MMRTLLCLAAASMFMLACGSSNTESKNPYTVADVQGNSAAAPSGQDIYKRACASCHMANGEGLPNVYPPLAQSDYLADKEKTITQIIKGSSGEMVVNGKTYNNVMPPQQLDDAEIAAVLTWVYSLNNGGATITANDVKAVRAKLQ